MTALVPADAAARPRAALRRPWPALLGPIDAADAEALDTLASTRLLPRGQPVFQRGAPARALIALIDGQAVCGRLQPARGISAERVMHGPEWLSLGGAWSDDRHACDALAQTDVRLAELPLEPLRALLLRRPLLALRFVDQMARELGRVQARLHELMCKDAGARLAAWITAQFEAGGQGVLRLTDRKRDIASQLGMTPETLSRLMRNLSERGLIAVSGYTVRVLDAPGLQRLAGS